MSGHGQRISVAMATYNGARFLGEQLDSIYGQTVPPDEVYVSDDCSSDGTAEILEAYARSHGLRYGINTGTLGFVRNFERALAQTTGALVLLADQDDLWEPEKIEVLLAHRGSAEIVCSDSALIDAHGRLLAPSFRCHSALEVPDSDQFHVLLYSNFVQGATALVARSLLDRALPFPEGIFYHDWWLALVAARRGPIRYVDRALHRYRLHGGNDTGAMDRSSLLRRTLSYLRRPSEDRVRDLRSRLRQVEVVAEHLALGDPQVLRAMAYMRAKLEGRRVRATRIAISDRRYIYPDRRGKDLIASFVRDAFLD
ncbi:MAG: glycosyltransferase family 2 protein [Pseudomonadota bacterium]